MKHYLHKQTSKHSAQDLDDDRRKYEDLSEQRRAELSRERRGTEEVEAEVLALQRKVGVRAGGAGGQTRPHLQLWVGVSVSSVRPSIV